MGLQTPNPRIQVIEELTCHRTDEGLSALNRHHVNLREMRARKLRLSQAVCHPVGLSTPPEAQLDALLPFAAR